MNKLEKIYNVSIGVIISIYALVALTLLIFLPKYDIFFDGWWTAFIIAPALGNLLFHRNKISSLYLLVISIFILLGIYEVLTIKKCFTILLCLGIILLGISIVTSTIKIPQKKDSKTKFVPFYYVLFGATEEFFEGTYQGGYTKVFFGNLTLDLSNATIEDASTIKVVSLFGETTIILPENVDVTTTNINILGGTKNSKKGKKDKKNKKSSKVYIESMSIFGGTKIM